LTPRRSLSAAPPAPQGPSGASAPPVAFVCDEDASAKGVACELLVSFGWPMSRIFDLGGIEAARGTEAFMLLWPGMRRVVGHSLFNIAVDRSVAESEPRGG
jgi:8-hydroxy-5-deazaflavin:NADPH oxidoreductase